MMKKTLTGITLVGALGLAGCDISPQTVPPTQERMQDVRYGAIYMPYEVVQPGNIGEALYLQDCDGNGSVDAVHKSSHIYWMSTTGCEQFKDLKTVATLTITPELQTALDEAYAAQKKAAFLLLEDRYRAGQEQR